MAKILIAGGTGTLGRQLLPLFARRGLETRVLARHPQAPDAPALDRGVEMVAGDVRDPDALDQALQGVGVVVSAMTGFGGADPLGTKAVDRDGNAALIAAARRARVGSIVLVSIHEASATHAIELFRDKWAAEEALRSSGIGWTIIRPTAYLETWLGLIGGPLVASGKTRIFGRGRNPINFVSAADVARFVELAVEDATLRDTAIEVPGPENLTLDDLAATVESVTGREGVKQHLSPVVMRVAARVLRPVNPVLSAQIATSVVMDTRDMSVDGPVLRASHPSIPLTTARDVARRMFA